jgi:phosphoglycolate phosphatase (TIGR01487 family)
VKRLELAKIEAVVIDYDRTLSDEELRPSTEALAALTELRRVRNWRFIIASGRPLTFFLGYSEIIGLADVIVGENGAVIYFPRDGRRIVVANGDLSRIRQDLSRLGTPIEAFDVILSVRRKAEEIVKKVVAKADVDAKIEYNMDTLMIMPRVVGKLSGIRRALETLGVEGGFIAFGDGENDVEVTEAAEFGVAVANATEVVKAKADHVTVKPYGSGVAEFIRGYLL